jgi:hypothetical protein
MRSRSYARLSRILTTTSASPGWGDDWSMEEHDAAKAALDRAQEHESRFVKKARR